MKSKSRVFVLEIKGGKIEVEETLEIMRSITGVKLTEMKKYAIPKRKKV